MKLMELFAAMERDDYEEVLFCQDKASGLKAIIAIHDTTLGPALGGTNVDLCYRGRGGCGRAPAGQGHDV